MPPGITVRFDFFAILILLGIGQGLFLAYFFLTGERRKVLGNLFLGFILLSLVSAITEVFLCYTNYMFEVIWLIDFAEPTNLLIAPLTYFYIYSKLYPHFPKKNYWHLAPFIFYLFYSLTWQTQNLDCKYNAYIDAYHPELPYRDAIHWMEEDPWLIREYTNELMLFSMIIYYVLSLLPTYQAFRKENLNFWSDENANLSWVRRVLIQITAMIALYLIVKTVFYRDLGDHILASHIALVIYFISFSIVGQSVFFNAEKNAKKYVKSSLTSEIQSITLKKLGELMRTKKPFLEADFSLPTLASKLTISPHHLSQILNEELKQSFFEFAAEYRIEEAKLLLQKPENANLKIEEIAERVGYNSKSSFNTSFKKLVGQTPSEYRKTQNA